MSKNVYGSLSVGFSVSVAVLTITWLAAEGAYSIIQKNNQTTNIIYQVYKKLTVVKSEDMENLYEKKNNIGNLLPNYIHDEKSVEYLLDEFRQFKILLGNSPYTGLTGQEARMTYTDSKTGILRNKPNIVVDASFLRSRIFFNYDPLLVLRIRNGSPIDESVKEFISKYSYEGVSHGINEKGERITVPQVESSEIMLVVGDSNAFGVMVNDHETLASRLQQRYQNRKFVNAGVPGSGIADSFQILEEKLTEYGEKVVGVIYVHTENDWGQGYKPKRLVYDLNNLLDRHCIDFRAFIYTEYIYRTMPDVVRTKSQTLTRFINLKNKTVHFLEKLDFPVVTLYDLVQQEKQNTGSLIRRF